MSSSNSKSTYRYSKVSRQLGTYACCGRWAGNQNINTKYTIYKIGEQDRVGQLAKLSRPLSQQCLLSQPHPTQKKNTPKPLTQATFFFVGCTVDVQRSRMSKIPDYSVGKHTPYTLNICLSSRALRIPCPVRLPDSSISQALHRGLQFFSIFFS